MKITKRRGAWALMLAGAWCMVAPVRADVYLPKDRSGVPSVKNTDNVISAIPVLGKIPRSFIVGDGFRFKFTGHELRIDHMGSNSNSAGKKRNCMIGFSYTTPVAFFGSRVDVPLFHAERPNLSEWGMNTPGDYVVHFSKDATVDHPIMGLSLTARF